MQPVLILAGAAVTGLAAISLGLLAARALRLPLAREERVPVAFLLGSAILSLIVFFLCATHLYYRGVVFSVCAVILVFGWRARRFGGDRESLTPLSRLDRLLLLLFVPFTVLYLSNAMAPEISPDGSTYHLGIIAHYVRAHGFLPLHTTIYASLSEGVELLYLIAFTIGRHSAAAVVHLLFFGATIWLMICLGRRIGHPTAAIFAAFLFYASPVAGVEGSAAYIDVAAAGILFAVFYLLEIWRVERSTGFLIAIGVLGGFAFAAKYTAGVILIYALGTVLVVERRLRPVLIVAMCATALVAPWLVKNSIFTGNPLAPFFNRWFPNQYTHVQWEDDYKAYFRTYDMKDLRMIPWDATVRGEVLGGLIGPMFLLTPLAFLAIRRPLTRRLLLAGAICLIPYPLNIGARFLIPALPFLGLATAQALAMVNVRIIFPALMLATAFLSWPKWPPGLLSEYCGPTWRLIHVPWKAALRIETEEGYLVRMQGAGYLKARLIDKLVPPGKLVFAPSTVADAYTSHEVVVSFQSALGENLNDLLITGFKDDRQGIRLMRFRFPAARFRRLRVEQTAAPAFGEQWAANEIRVFDGGRELPPKSSWRLTAQPNPFEIHMAFDNSTVTRWRSQQQPKPGDHIEIDFGESKLADRLDFETSSDHWSTRIRLLGSEAASGSLRVLAETPEELPLKPAPYSRRAVTIEIAARGVDYLLIDQNDYMARDVFEAPETWGLTLLGEAGGGRLYRIDPLPQPNRAQP